MNIYLVQILGSDSFNHFLVSQLNDAYSKLSGDKYILETRKFVYRETIRLFRSNLLSRNGGRYCRSTIYEKTDLFNNIEFIEKSPHKVTNRVTSIPKSREHNDTNLNYELDHTLQKYKVDMMSAIGESEEYVRLLDAFPEMKSILSKNYENARDNSSKLLGKIKAVRAILSLQDDHKMKEMTDKIRMGSLKSLEKNI
jgi:hypothetical protein